MKNKKIKDYQKQYRENSPLTEEKKNERISKKLNNKNT